MASSVNSLDSKVFENYEHRENIFYNLKQMYDENFLVDVILCLQDKKISCHRNVLAASSPYFKAMFHSNLTECEQKEVTIHEVDPDCMTLIVEYAYTGSIEITRNNVQDLLAASSLFQIGDIQRACARFMESQLDVSNCIGIYCFAQIHNCDDLRIKGKEHIEKYFVDVSQGDEFLQLSPDRVADIISSNELNVETEESVFEALLRWVRHNETERRQHVATLLPLIRFGLLNSKYIQENIVNNQTVTQCEECLQLLEKVKDFESNPETYSGEHIFTLSLRSGMIKPEHCILLIGGVNQGRKEDSHTINCYNPVTREAYCMADLHEEGKAWCYDVEDPACVVTEDNQIYVAGGNFVCHEVGCETPSEDSFDSFDYEENSMRKHFFQYDNDHDTWVSRAPMLFPKSNFSLAYTDGFIYCFGGLTVNQHPTEIIEKYDLSSNRWSYVGMMPTTLVDLSSVVHDGQIYVLGGRTGVGAHNMVMRFDPKKNEWASRAGMPTPRFNFGACVVGDEIYVAGGQIYSHKTHTINREALSSVEIYDIDHNQWRQGPELPEDIYNVGLHLHHNKLYACGTTEYQRSTYRIYRYNVVYILDLAKCVWEQIETDLCDIRDYACVMAKMHTRKLSQVFRPEVDT